MKFFGQVVCIDLYYKAGVILDRRSGRKFVFKQRDCKNKSLPSLNQTVSFEPEETDYIDIARFVECKKKAA